MAQLFEVMMLVCFGISWPISVVKSIKSKSTAGKSMIFTIVIIIGYICGITSKVLSGHITYVLWLYVLNLVVVTMDLVVFIINKHNEKHAHAVQDDDFVVAYVQTNGSVAPVKGDVKRTNKCNKKAHASEA